MTVAAGTPVRADYTGNGSSTGPYGFTFPLTSTNFLKVILTDTNGNDSIKTYGVDYTVTGVKAPTDYSQGGNVNFTSAPSANFHISLLLNLDGSQGTDTKNQERFLGSVHEAEFDLLALFSLQQLERILKSMRAPDSEAAGLANLVMPSIANRSGKFAAWDINGNLVANVGTSGPAGPAGPQGPAGPTGATGAQGPGISTYANQAALPANPGAPTLAYTTDLGILWFWSVLEGIWKKVVITS